MGLMGEPHELPYFFQTANAWKGVHKTGMVERRYTDVRLRPEDFTDDALALAPTAENIAWWDQMLAVLGEYEVFILEHPPTTLDAKARVLGFANFFDFVDFVAPEGDLERLVEYRKAFLDADEEEV